MQLIKQIVARNAAVKKFLQELTKPVCDDDYAFGLLNAGLYDQAIKYISEFYPLDKARSMVLKFYEQNPEIVDPKDIAGIIEATEQAITPTVVEVARDDFESSSQQQARIRDENVYPKVERLSQEPQAQVNSSEYTQPPREEPIQYAAPRHSQPAVSPVHRATVESSGLPSLEERKELFKRRLKAEKPLLQLCGGSPVQIYGPQRSRKSSLAWSIALIAKLYRNIPVTLATPHFESDNIPPPVFKLVGRGRDYVAIANLMQQYGSSIGKGDTKHELFIWDEFTNYGEHFAPGRHQDVLAAFAKSLLSESAKHNKFHIIIAHGDTTSFVGGGKGTHEARSKGFIKVERTVVDNPDYDVEDPESKPTLYSPLVRIKGLGNGFDQASAYEYEIPDWFCPRYIMRLFPELIPNQQKRDQELRKLEALHKAATEDYDYRGALTRSLEMLISCGVPPSAVIKGVLKFQNNSYLEGRDFLEGLVPGFQQKALKASNPSSQDEDTAVVLSTESDNHDTIF